MAPHILCLPIELRMIILRKLPEIEDVYAAIKSHRIFYHAFKQDPALPGYFVQKRINPKLWPHALTILHIHAGLVSLKDEIDVEELLIECRYMTHQTAKEELSRVTLSDAHDLLRLHNAIEYFTLDYSTKALAVMAHHTTGKTSPDSVSASEIYRFERSFYCFELYCSIFGASGPPRESKGRFGIDEQESLFLRNHAEWENDQLACVHGYLSDEISYVFGEVAAHDVEWGNRRINWVTSQDTENAWIQWLLSFGIQYVFEVWGTPTYEGRRELLTSKLPSQRSDLAAHGIQGCQNFGGRWIEIPDDELHFLMEELHDASWFGANDPSPGPAEMWKLLHLQARPFDAYRKAGYVLWDSVRIDDFTRFDSSWSRWPMIPTREYMKQHIQMWLSWDTRARIWAAGGRGWWSAEDESKIEWLGGSS